MASKAIAISTIVLRVATLLLLASSIVVLVTNTFTNNTDGSKTTFKDVIAYKHVLAAGVIGFAYTLFQIPFAVYYVSTGKRMISNDCLPEFDFYGDKVISYLLATGTGAGFGVTFEFKKFLNALFDSLVALNVAGADELRSKSERFLDRGNIATGLLFLGFLCMVVLSVLSSIDRNTSKGFSG